MSICSCTCRIARLHQSGIITYLRQKWWQSHVHRNVQNELAGNQLNMQHVYGLFYNLALMLGVSTLILVAELCIYRLTKYRGHEIRPASQSLPKTWGPKFLGCGSYWKVFISTNFNNTDEYIILLCAFLIKQSYITTKPIDVFSSRHCTKSVSLGFLTIYLQIWKQELWNVPLFSIFHKQ